MAVASKFARLALVTVAGGTLLGAAAGPASAGTFGDAAGPERQGRKVECQDVTTNMSICKITVWGNEYVVLCEKISKTCTPGA